MFQKLRNLAGLQSDLHDPDFALAIEHLDIAQESWVKSISAWTVGEKFSTFRQTLKTATDHLRQAEKFSANVNRKKFKQLPTHGDLIARIAEIRDVFILVDELLNTRMPTTQAAYDVMGSKLLLRLKKMKTFNLIMVKNVKHKERKYRIYLPPKAAPVEHAPLTAPNLGYSAASLNELITKVDQLCKELPKKIDDVVHRLQTFEQMQRTQLKGEKFTPADGRKYFVNLGVSLVESSALFLLIRLPYVCYDTITAVEQLSTVYE